MYRKMNNYKYAKGNNNEIIFKTMQSLNNESLP